MRARAATGKEKAKKDVREAQFQRKLNGKVQPVAWPRIDTSGLGPCCVELVKVKSPKEEKDGRELVCPGQGCSAVLRLDHGVWGLKFFWNDGGKREMGMLPGFDEMKVRNCHG